MVFNGEKELDSSWTVVWERFYQKGVYRLSKLWNRDIDEGGNYFLPDSTWHRIDSSENTTTLFLVDKTYKTMGFPKNKNPELKRWHAKRLPREQEDYESRGYDDYGIGVEELSGIVHWEINYILN